MATGGALSAGVPDMAGLPSWSITLGFSIAPGGCDRHTLMGPTFLDGVPGRAGHVSYAIDLRLGLSATPSTCSIRVDGVAGRFGFLSVASPTGSAASRRVRRLGLLSHAHRAALWFLCGALNPVGRRLIAKAFLMAKDNCRIGVLILRVNKMLRDHRVFPADSAKRERADVAEAAWVGWWWAVGAAHAGGQCRAGVS